jgi:hypothetical protein
MTSHSVSTSVSEGAGPPSLERSGAVATVARDEGEEVIPPRTTRAACGETSAPREDAAHTAHACWWCSGSLWESVVCRARAEVSGRWRYVVSLSTALRCGLSTVGGSGGACGRGVTARVRLGVLPMSCWRWVSSLSDDDDDGMAGCSEMWSPDVHPSAAQYRLISR